MKSLRNAIGWFLFLLPSATFGVPLDTIGTFCSTFPDQCRKGTTSLLAARGIGTDAYYVVEVDPTTGEIPTSASLALDSEGTPGAAAPSKALQVGGTDGTNLRALKTGTDGAMIVGTGTAAVGTTNPLSIILSDGSNNMSSLHNVTNSQATVNNPGRMIDVFTITAGWDGSTHREMAVTTNGTVKVDGSAVTQPISAATLPSSTGRAYADSVRYDYSGGTVTTGAWTQLIAATAAAINCVTVFDSSGQTLELGTGGAGVEARKLIIPPGGHDGCIPLAIGAGTRVSVRAISNDADTGELDITGLN